MAKILGLDLGTNSIGWAVIDATIVDGKIKNYHSIINSGVRIFPEGVEPTTIGQGDKEQSKNASRREHRQMRRQFYRKKLRKVKLLEALIQLKMCPLSINGLHQWSKWNKERKSEGKQFPTEPEFVEWLKLNPYELRTKALTEAISLPELGRIFYHFIQRRGFLSSRKGSEEGKIFESKDNMSGIDATRVLMNGNTLGKTLHDISYKDGEKYNLKTDTEGKELRVRSRYTQRDMYIAEFQQIWKKQAAELGLDQQKIKVSKVRFLKGNPGNNRNQSKIESCYKRFGKDLVVVEGKKITTFDLVPLKEFFAGKIEEQEGGLKFKSNESLLFWQRPLRSQKGLLDNCRFENNLPVIMSNGQFRMKNGKVVTRNKKPCPLSHPEFELFRTYQFINNIKYGKNLKLTDDQRQTVLDLINSKDNNFTFEEIPKALHLTYEKFNYDNDLKVPGNSTIKKLKPLFPKDIWQAHSEKIWHCFYFFEDNDMLFTKLKDDFQLKISDPEKISKIRLKEGYSNVSLKAIRNISPFLEKGYAYSDAVILGGVKNVFGSRWPYFDLKDSVIQLEKDITSILHEDNKEGEAIEKIKDYLAEPVNSYGFSKDDPHFSQLYHPSQDVMEKEKQAFVPEVENLRNPIVQQALYEMRRLVNALLMQYRKADPEFTFDRIHIEMGRDLKNTKSKRRELTLKIRDNEQKNEEARQRLAEFGLRPTRDNLLRYLLYEEIQKHVSGAVLCPYTGKVINMNDLLGGSNAVQIEHMIPYSVSLDDSFGNKTLCEGNFNRMKGEKTPYEYYLTNPDYKLWGINNYQNPEYGWKEISERAFKLLPYPKAKRFVSKRDFKTSDFIERQLNDTRYISRKAVELLSAICDDVRMLPGQVTAELRHLWGINNILNPVHGISNFKSDVREKERIPYYVITDEENNVQSIHRKTNDRPEAQPDQLVLTGEVNKGIFSSKYMNLKIDTPDMKDGNYWAIVNVSEPYTFQSVYANKPTVDEKHIVFKGRIEKHLFTNDTIGKRIKAENRKDGSYWAVFSILDKEFRLAEGKGKLKTSGSKIALFGEIKNNQFACHIYQCETNLPDGKYWMLLELNFEQADYLRSVNPKPDIHEKQILSYTTVDEMGLMVADPDPEYQIKTMQNPGRYYCVFDIESVKQELYPLENEPPVLEKGQRLTEAVVWIDEHTGEIKYDPKKKRDDHRHHAIDAITVALTEQGFLQRLSTYHAQEENKKRGISSSEKFPEPWTDFANDVKKVANGIFISHKQNNKVLTKISKTVIKNGEKYLSVGEAVRGELHEMTLYGKKDYCKEKEFTTRVLISKLKYVRTKGQAVYLDDIIDSSIKKAIYQVIKENLTDNENIILNEIEKRLAHIQKVKKANDRENEMKVLNNFRKKINNSVENILQQKKFFLDNVGKRSKKLGRYKEEEKRDPVPIKKVKVKKVFNNALLLKYLKHYSSVKQEIVSGAQFINPGNNHHVLIYEDFEGNLQEKVVTFIEVVERLKGNDPIYKLPEDGKRIIASLEINAMFLLGIDDDVEISNVNAAALNKHLYRVQKISSSYYTFRHHLASTLDDSKTELSIRSMKAWKKMNPIKVNIDILGNIKTLSFSPSSYYLQNL